MLCGCDYLEPIKGVGAKTALKLVREYDTMDEILAHLRKGKNPPPEDWPWEEAKELFKKPEVTPASEIKLEWKAPDVDGLVDFLVRQHGFKFVKLLICCFSLLTIEVYTARSVYAREPRSSKLV
jgi:flap endonuclease-1